MDVITRFAPSPTGFLHIGGARTALFNWLFAQHHKGRYLLRIEDTDRVRSTKEAVAAIFDGLNWLGISSTEPAVFQFDRIERHRKIAEELLDNGNAYRCYCSREELEQMRILARKEGRAAMYDGRWRNKDPKEAPIGINPVIRLKTPLKGKTTLTDLVQGSVTVANSQVDDFVLIRADNTPTYMLSVVVDDHDMGVTHVIRGNDHLNNAFRQTQLYNAMGWALPKFAHVPLIHGQDGGKLSKRHGATGVEAYREMGYLPEALFNYLLRLGWSHGDDEIISRLDAIKWFDLTSVGRSASQFDIAKLDNLNKHYLTQISDQKLIELVKDRLKERPRININDQTISRIRRGIGSLKIRNTNLNELSESLAFYAAALPLPINEKASAILDDKALNLIYGLIEPIKTLNPWTEKEVETLLLQYTESRNVKLKAVAQPLRVALTGSNVSPAIFEVLTILGRDEVVKRIESVC